MDLLLPKVQKQQHHTPNLLRTIFTSVIICFSMTIAAPIFYFYRKLVDIYLAFRLGKAYGGLISTEDMLFFFISKLKYSISTVIYMRSEKEFDFVGKVRQVMQQKVFDCPDRYPKLTSTTHQFGGYFYRKKYQCNVDDAVKTIKVKSSQEFSEEFLKKYSAKVNTDEFGKNGTMLWELHVASRPLINDEAQNIYIYPIIARFHHSLTDGTSLISWLIQVCGDKSCENYCQDIFKKFTKYQQKVKKFESWPEWIAYKMKNLFQTIIFYLEIVFISFGRITEMDQLKPNDINSLHADKCTDKKICAWVVEDKEECIPMIKNIKNRENTGFNIVLITAILASLSQYFKRNNLLIPEYISGLYAYLLKYPDQDSSKPVALENKTGALTINLPMICGFTTLSKLLRNVGNECKKVRRTDALLSAFIIHQLGCIPFQVAKHMIGFRSQTLFLTNVPGGSKVTTLDGLVCERIIPIAPNLEGIGVSIGILSYAERLHIGVLIDKTLVNSQEEVQQIADDILVYIKLLDSETKKI